MENRENLDQYIEGYDDNQLFSYDMNIWMSWYVKRLQELLKGASCLELGIGHGYTTNTFSKHFRNYVVIEGSAKMIERFNEMHPNTNIAIELAYFEDFDTSNKYDVILMGYVLEHVENPEFILRKFKNYLKQNGALYVVVPNGSALNRRFGLKAGYIKSLDEMSDFDYVCGHKRTFTYESITELVERCQFRINKIEGIFLKCMATSQMIELKLPDKIIDAMCKVGVEYPELCACILLELKHNL